MRGLAYKRFQREKHIKRKERIISNSRLDNPPHKYDTKDLFDITPIKTWTEGYWIPYWTVKARGELSKGKIHCSCSMCSSKTRNKGRRRQLYGNYAPAINYKHSDLQKINQMDWDEKNWEQEEEDIQSDLIFEKKYWWLKNKLSEEKFDFLKNF